jgi:hypothetical protein
VKGALVVIAGCVLGLGASPFILPAALAAVVASVVALVRSEPARSSNF